MAKGTSITNKIINKSVLIACCLLLYVTVVAQKAVVHFVFTSDLHYGIYRPHFRGNDSVASYIVNAAQREAIRRLSFRPAAIIVTGDIANRAEKGIQPAAVSWKEFLHDYGDAPRLLLTPGNHDASNVIGYTKALFPARDASSMAGMYSMMLGHKIDTANYDYHRDKINYSVNMAGVHMMFVNIWADSANRVWMEKDLALSKSTTPVLLFMHDPPEGDPKHFSRPSEAGDSIFENLLEEKHKDADKKSDSLEQGGLLAFLKKHPNIKAWFHGHSNYTEMYNYTGRHHEISLPVFRADSPMKGRESRNDETKLSFQLITIDAVQKKLTVKECLWNTKKKKAPLVWGKQRTISLR